MNIYDEIISLDYRISKLNTRILFGDKDNELHPHQVPLLECIKNNPGCTQVYAARIQNVSAASVGVSVRRLMAAGYVRIAPDCMDHRVRRLHITEEGEKAMEISKARLDEINTIKLSGLTREELETYRELLNKVYNNIYSHYTKER